MERALDVELLDEVEVEVVGDDRQFLVVVEVLVERRLRIRHDVHPEQPLARIERLCVYLGIEHPEELERPFAADAQVRCEQHEQAHDERLGVRMRPALLKK